MATIKVMKSQLKEMGITFPAKASHGDLEALLADSLNTDLSVDSHVDAPVIELDDADVTGEASDGQSDDIDAPELFSFKNTGKRNYFTEAGRCMAGETVQLTEEQGAQYALLEKI